MCGILATRFEHETPEVLAQRGKDGSAIVRAHGVQLSHCLHSVVGNVAQPLEGKGVFAANCEVYNWRELAETHGVYARNDAHLVFELLERLDDDVFIRSANDSMIDPRLSSLLGEFSGSYAIVYIRAGFLFALRDPLGIRPIIYASDAISSSHEALQAVGRSGVELHPRRMLWWNLNAGGDEATARGTAYIPAAFTRSPRSFDEELVDAVVERFPESGPVFVLLSGGVDSSLVAAIASQHRETIGVTVSAQGPQSSDHEAALKVAEALDIDVLEVIVDSEEIPAAALDIARAIGEPHALKVTTALTTYFAARAVSELGGKVLLSGFGADEVLVAYSRGKLNYAMLAESWAQLLKLWESNALKEDASSMRHTVEVRYPYLDLDVIAAGWKGLTPSYETKPAVRDALRSRGLVDIADRPKKASQYGSRLDGVLSKHVRSLDLSKSEFLSRSASGKRVGVLVSGGKDSLYAAFLLKRFCYELTCMMGIASENLDSYMFHTPTTNVLPAVADRLGLPLVLESSPGVKERELDALRTALSRAIADHAIVAIGCGAIKSNYQRDRLLLLCEEFGLSLHAPLWQFDELTYAQQLDDYGFSVIVTRVAADGLVAEDVGRMFSLEWAKSLAERGISPVGEGGEFETLVLDCPLYSSPIAVKLENVVRDGSDAIGIFSLE